MTRAAGAVQRAIAPDGRPRLGAATHMRQIGVALDAAPRNEKELRQCDRSPLYRDGSAGADLAAFPATTEARSASSALSRQDVAEGSLT